MNRRSKRDRVLASASRLVLEALEERVLLATLADGGTAATIRNSLDEVAILVRDVQAPQGLDFTVPMVLDDTNHPTLNSKFGTAPRAVTAAVATTVPTDPGAPGVHLAALNEIDGAISNDGLVDFAEVFRKKFVDEVATFLNDAANHDNAAFVTFLNSLDGSVAGNFGWSTHGAQVVSTGPADPAALGETTNGALSFKVTFDLTRSRDYRLDLGRNADTLGLEVINETVGLDTTMSFSFTFGVEMQKTTQPIAGDPPTDFTVIESFGDFFIDTTAAGQGLTASFVINETDEDYDLRVGFLDLVAKDADLALNASVTLKFDDTPSTDGNAAGHVTLGEFDAPPIDFANFVTVSKTGSLTGNFPIEIAPIPGTTDPFFELDTLVPVLNVGLPGGGITAPELQPDGSSDPRSAPALSVSDFSELLKFNNVKASGIIGIINQFAGSLIEIKESALFTTEIPFTQGKTLGDLLRLDDLLKDSLLLDDLDDADDLNDVIKLIDGDGNAQFVSAQTLAAKIVTVLGINLDTVDPSYDLTTHELKFTISIDVSDQDFDFDPATAGVQGLSTPIGFDLNLGELADISSSATVSLTADAGLSFTFGINLQSDSQVVLESPLVAPVLVALLKTGGVAATPANASLSADAVFRLTVGGIGAVDVTVPAFAGTGDINDLVDHIQTAVDAAVAQAGIGLEIVVGSRNGRITFSTPNSNFLRITIGDAATNTAATELGFAPGQEASGSATPSNGILPGNATFILNVENDPTDYTITVTGTGNNTSLADLVDDINAAFLAAPGFDAYETKVTAALNNNESAIVIRSDLLGFLRVRNPNAIAASDLGLQDGLTAGRISVVSDRDLRLEATNTVATSTNGQPGANANFNLHLGAAGPTGTPITHNIPIAVLKNRTVSVTALGFADGASDTGTLVAAIKAPADGKLAGELAFTLTVSADSAQVTLAAATAAGNTTRQQLLTQLNDAVAAAGLDDVVTASLNASGFLVFTSTAPGDIITVDALTVNNASNTSDNTSIDHLVADINAALAAARLPDGTSVGSLVFADRISVTDADAEPDLDAYRLVLIARGSALISSIEIQGGNAAFTSGTGFSAAQGPEPLLGVAPNGRLTSPVAFNVTLNNGAPVSFTITAAQTSTNASIDDLVADINLALSTSSLNGKVVASRFGTKIAFSATESGATSLKVFTNETPTAGQVGFGSGPTAVAEEDAGEIFFEGINASANVTLAATNVEAAARFGFVGIESTGGGGSVGVNVSFHLDDANANDRFSLTDLFDTLTDGDVDSIIAPPTVDWFGDFTFGNIALDTGLPGFNDLASSLTGTNQVVVGFSNFETTGIPTIDASSLEGLLDFQELDFGSVLDMLQALTGFLQGLEQFEFLDDKIPVINRSVADLIGSADQFVAAVQDLQDNPSSVIQTLEGRLKEAFGLPSVGGPISIGYDAAAKEFTLNLNFTRDFDQQFFINLDIADLAEMANIPGLADVLNLSGSGALSASGSASVNLAFGINLATFDPADPLAHIFLDTANSGVEFEFQANGQNLTFVGGFGPVGLYVNDGVAAIDDGDPNTTDPMSLTVALQDNDGTSDGRVTLDKIADVGLSVDFTGGVSATLPIFFPTESNFLGNIDLKITDLEALFGGDTSVITLDVPDLSQFLSGDFSLIDNLRLAVDGLDLLLGGIQDGLDGEIGGVSLPLIGDQLSGAVQFIDDLRGGLIAELREILDNSVDKSAELVRATIQQFLSDNGLLIGNVTKEVGADDEFVKWNMTIGQQLVLDEGFAFDIGLPGLGLESDGEITITLDWQLDLGFGLSLEDGFFFELNDGADDPELSVNFGVSLDGSSLGATLAFLKVTATDAADDDTAFTGQFSIDLSNGSSNKVTLNDLGNLDADFGIEGQADVHLDLRAELDPDLVGSSGVFPSIVAGFDLIWMFDEDTGIGGEITELSFNSLGVDVGSFISEFLTPILGEIQNITEPIQPLVDIVTAPIPVLSDLAGKPITLIDIAGLTGYVEPGLIYAIADIITLVNSIPTDLAPGDNLVIYFDEFLDLGGQADGLKNGTLDLSNPGSFSLPALGDLDLEGALSGLSGPGAASASSFTKKLTTGGFGGGFAFPIFEDASQVMNLLLGRDAVLMTYDMDPLKFGFTYTQFFPIWGPLGVSLTGSAELAIDLAFGYDTSGIRKFAEGNFQNPLDIFRGFYVSDTVNADGSGAENPEVSFKASIVAAAEINVGVARAGVGGGVFAEVNFDLNDPKPDGRVHIDEILNNLYLGFTELAPLGPLAIFDISGKVTARLVAFIEILFVIDKEFPIGPEIPLIEFDLTPERPPVLATELGDGVLRLNMGAKYAADRLHQYTTDIAESFSVTSVDSDTVKVTATFNGESFTQTYENVSRIIADGGQENDTIDLSGITHSSISAEISGNFGDDTIKGGAGPVTLLGDSGNDSLVGGSGNDSLVGGEGLDTVAGGAGNDAIDGGGDNDSLSGDAGDDTILAGAGKDTVSGGDNDDYIDGGLDADSILGDGGADTVEGGAGPDTISGGADNDLLGGGADGDSIDGDAGLDFIYGDSSFDVAGNRVLPDPGTSGSDTINGGTEDDDLFGEAGNDSIHGNDGNDSAEGGLGADTIYGDNDQDTVLGQADGDILFGNAGNDTVIGDAGNDILFGDDGLIDRAGADLDPLSIDLIATVVNVLTDGDDSISAGAGDDTAFGGAGIDRITGDAAVPVAAGPSPTGFDVLFGDGGQVELSHRRNVVIKTLDPDKGAGDFLYGNNGNDTLLGGFGFDEVNGGHGLDSVATTGADLDVLIGDNGQLLFNELVDPLKPKTSQRRVTVIETTDLEHGGDDTLYGQDQSDTLFGGFGADSVVGSTGNDVALGDNGRIEYQAGLIELVETTDTVSTTGGNDTVLGDADNDVALGGVGDDSVSGSGGDDVLLGDNGLLDYDTGDNDATTLDLIESKLNLGGVDNVTGAAGADIALGGFEGDFISGGAQDDVLLGDNGRITLIGGVISLIETTDVVSTTGGNDTIEGNEDSDIALGGVGSDTIHGNTGPDILLGDNGTLDYDTGDGNLSTLDLIQTGTPDLGDTDLINGNEGNDTVVGGAFGDSLNGNEADDLLLGDGAEIVFTNGVLAFAQTIHTATGGVDSVHGNGGNDTAFGGTAGDYIDGDAGHDLLFGDHGRIDFTGATTNPLVRVLAGSTLYNPANPGFYDADVTAAFQINPAGAAIQTITLFDKTLGNADSSFGNDTIAGGSENDSLFGQLGNDLLQGDSSTAEVVSAVDPSVEAATDGDDYVEGNGGADLIFGNLGQDDLIGGSSDLFGLTNPAQRLDGTDTIFGGAGTDLARNNLGDESANGHARDADMILGDNGRIFRLVGTGGVSATAFLTFTYDNYAGGLRIIPRAVEMLDYTPGSGNAADNGAADLLHGESGDDSIHGMTGDDAIFGEGQDDDLFGEAGADWISGGSGEDGVLGDDGKILTSRNGSTELLIGLTSPTVQRHVALPGNSHVADLNVAGQLKKAVDLEPWDLGGNDTVYGGLGDDSLHGGAGNDAISGAEALAAFYAAADSPDVLFNAVTGKFVGFVDDPSQESLRKIANHALNFEGLELDGNDAIFGDIGNDWLVGGRGSDHMFGGFGNDIHNADDFLETNGGANDVPDPDPFAEADTVYGGGGRDTLLGNTGADRLADWVGEFNSYIVPFAPFGDRTVTRQILPALPQFFIDLAESDGSDQTRVGPGLGTVLRRGEPFGELGLVLQHDPVWQDQTGGPVDPQAGNKPGGPKDKR